MNLNTISFLPWVRIANNECQYQLLDRNIKSPILLHSNSLKCVPLYPHSHASFGGFFFPGYFLMFELAIDFVLRLKDI
jgi:hypothetical protein